MSKIMQKIIIIIILGFNNNPERNLPSPSAAASGDWAGSGLKRVSRRVTRGKKPQAGSTRKEYLIA